MMYHMNTLKYHLERLVIEPVDTHQLQECGNGYCLTHRCLTNTINNMEDFNNHSMSETCTMCNTISAIINDLVRMQQNLDFMDENVKGVTQLKNRMKSVFTTLKSNQYEVADLIGRSYHEGDNMTATFELNETMPTGTNRIKRVIKPQISFQGKMIHAAEVVVEYNE